MLKLGIIGMSEGNGHPYSWSAIINGDFDRKEMDDCGFAGIPLYLEANSDTLGINDVQVTHVWTQDKNLSTHIAKATGIENVVDSMEDMIGEVDGVLLARDDPENHVAMAKPFLDANVPIFIDKPLANSTKDLAYFVEQNKKGKLLMSSSSMRYSSECRAAKTELASLGKIELATVVGKKDWVKYGVHMLEALFAILDDPKVVSVQNVGKSGQDIVLIQFESGLLATVHLFMDIAATFQLTLFGRDGWQLVDIKNSYSMFKENINEFIRSVQEGKSRLPFEKTENTICTLIAANESLDQNGKKIYLR
ncbi:MAG: Gfo/Idh/MocA family oxidoreductase [Ignavibacteriae bacterium]|nr:Gfo/Idh/MocA family oxidoreductase [Ignavibacteriota bacterium]